MLHVTMGVKVWIPYKIILSFLIVNKIQAASPDSHWQRHQQQQHSHCNTTKWSPGRVGVHRTYSYLGNNEEHKYKYGSISSDSQAQVIYLIM